MLTLVLTTLLFAIQSLAGDASTYHTLGFSKDGKYFAYAQTGMYDGSGFAYAEIIVKKVERDVVVQSLTEVIEDETSNADPLLEALKKINLSSYGISLSNKGRELLVRLDTDLSEYKNAKFSFEGADANFMSPTYELKLKEVTVKTTPTWCEEYGMNMAARLSITTSNAGKPSTTPLKNDDLLPDSCAGNYSITRVLHQGDSLVVIVAYQTVGFEGPDSRYFAVTGDFAH